MGDGGTGGWAREGCGGDGEGAGMAPYGGNKGKVKSRVAGGKGGGGVGGRKRGREVWLRRGPWSAVDASTNERGGGAMARLIGGQVDPAAGVTQ